ncbi:MAG: DUF6580 family putative transport protein [Verrucomicrobiota bacterium]
MRFKMAVVKSKVLLPAIFVLVFAVSRIPGLMPLNFSVAYALAFCSGAFFRGPRGWWLPLATIFVTDIGLNLYYQQQSPNANVWSAANLLNLLFNYVAYALLIFLGRRFKPQSWLINLVAGGILGAILFYFLTNTASWLINPYHNPEYTKTLTGWLIALTKGTAGYPPTWEFFRNTLLSGGLFTLLFGALGKLTAESPCSRCCLAPSES